MEIQIIQGARPGTNLFLEQAFKLRHRIFVEEKGWEALRQPDGRECDQFDGPQCIYVLAVEQRAVIGHMRMTPTTHPHLLSEIHSHLCVRPEPRGPDIWEWTRYCVQPKVRGKSKWGQVAASVQIAAMEWLFMHGVRDIVVEYHPKFIERHLELGFTVDPLGLPSRIESESVVAVHMSFDFNTLYRTRVALGVPRPILMKDPVAATA